MTILLFIAALVATLCISFAATPFVKRRPFSLPFLAIALPASLLMAMASAPTLWIAILSGYPDDSFFDLGFFGGLGVLAISGTLITLFALIIVWKSRKVLAIASKRRLSGWLVLAFDCALGLALFGTLHALSPQAFYQFYHLTHSGLPNQIVVKTLFDYEGMITFAALSTGGNLSQHLSGLVLLSIIPLTVFSHIKFHEKSGTQAKTHRLLLFVAPTLLVSVNFLRQF
ncbi:MAG: hypothetical protein ABJ034_07750 [Hyphomicrobiales bacterium]